MDKEHRLNQSEMKPLRRALRQHGTPAEGALWKLIKNRQVCGLSFRRQYSVDNYILDFYCPKLKLCIELDGEGHFDLSKGELDIQRTYYLNQLGITVQRFENKTIFDYPLDVVEWIKSYASQNGY